MHHRQVVSLGTHDAYPLTAHAVVISCDDRPNDTYADGCVMVITGAPEYGPTIPCAGRTDGSAP